MPRQPRPRPQPDQPVQTLPVHTRLPLANRRLGFSDAQGRALAEAGNYPVEAFKQRDNPRWYVFTAELERYCAKSEGVAG